MNKINFDAEMQKILGDKSQKILLHSCCAPCSSACLERLTPLCSVTVYYYNPNIDTQEEFVKRQLEQQRYCQSLGVKLITTDHQKEEFLTAVSGYEKEKEGGLRCDKCFYLRLKNTAKKAKELGFDAFMTTLTVSPLKNAELINKIGKTVEEETGVKYIPSDFKKRDGYKRSIELSNQHDLYRQNYCGCEFSKSKTTD